jgi:hypothetical protein
VAKITVRWGRLRREAHFWPRICRVGVWIAVGLAGHRVRVGLRPWVRVVRRIGRPVTGVLIGRFATGRTVRRWCCRACVRIGAGPVCGFGRLAAERVRLLAFSHGNQCDALFLSCSRIALWDPPPSSSLAEERTPLLSSPPSGGARFPTLAAAFLSCSRSALLVDQTERSDRVTLLDELCHAGIDLAAREVVDVQALHDLVGAT